MVTISTRWREKEEFAVYDVLDIQNSIVLLNDDGFLPEGVISPYRYYVQNNCSQPQTGTPLFADLLPVPELWEITMGYDKAEVWDDGTKKAEIEYVDSLNSYNVKAVRWMMPDGAIYKIDHYDRYGKLYYNEILDHRGEVDIRTYFAEGKPVLFCQPKRDLYTLMEKSGGVRIWNSLYQFTKFFIETVFSTEEVIVSEDRDIVKELVQVGLPCKQMECFETTFPRNPCGKEIYILTNSDQVEQLENLIVYLPQLRFHIAAVTAMSDKLLNLKKYQNVNLYPGIPREKRRELLQSCTYYLDINHYNEICDAVYEAYRHSLLIIGFDNTLHHRNYVLPECIFLSSEADRMGEFLKWTSENKEELLKLTMLQNRWPLQICGGGRNIL